MYIKICDRCGRKTKNGPAFLVPTNEEHGHYHLQGTWFGEPIVLCNNCLMDFDEFKHTHSNHNFCIEEEESIEYLQKVKETKEQINESKLNSNN
jgi:hypothetical protein